MFTIKLENLNRSGIKSLFVQNRKRLPTATGAAFIDKNHLVITSLVAMKMYLFYVNYDTNQYGLLDSMDTIYNHKLTPTELISFNGDTLLVTSNYKACSQTIYRIINNKLSFVKDIKHYHMNTLCHGACFNSTNNVVCSTIFENSSVNFVSIYTNQLIYRIQYNKLFIPKDVKFIGNNVIVAYTTSQIKRNKNNENRITRLVYYSVNLDEKNHNIITCFDIANSHCDSVIVHENTIFVNNQLRNSVNILKLEDNKISSLKEITGFESPHGLSYEPTNNLLAVTNYGNNTVNIVKLD